MYFFGNSMFKRSHQQRKVSQQRSFKLSSFKKMLLAKMSLNHLSPESQQSAFWILDLTVAFVKYWPQSTSKHSVQCFHENKSFNNYHVTQISDWSWMEAHGFCITFQNGSTHWDDDGSRKSTHPGKVSCPACCLHYAWSWQRDSW